jgi:hypothetical protein
MLNITRINQNSGAIKYPEVCIFTLFQAVTKATGRDSKTSH